MVDKSMLERWLVKLREGTLTEDDLERGLARLRGTGDSTRPPQRLLYLQTRNTAVDSPVNGMSVMEDGKIHEAPEAPGEWPYDTVIDAVNDGWRIVKFPELALLYQEPDDSGLACEFILEK